MPLLTTSKDELIDHLHQLGVKKNSHLCVHSQLMSFGLLKDGCETVYESLRQVVGAKGTIIVPGYTLHLDKNSIYDPMTTMPSNVGALSKYMLTLPGVKRSICPMHNHIGIGDKSFLLEKIDGDKSLGHGSDFQMFYENDFQLLMLGCPLHRGATYLHHLEALAKVPYRHWVNVPRSILGANNNVKKILCRYYGRKSNLWVEAFENSEKFVGECGVIKTVKANYGSSSLISINDLHVHIMKALRQNPYFMINFKN